MKSIPSRTRSLVARGLAQSVAILLETKLRATAEEWAQIVSETCGVSADSLWFSKSAERRISAVFGIRLESGHFVCGIAFLATKMHKEHIRISENICAFCAFLWLTILLR